MGDVFSFCFFQVRLNFKIYLVKELLYFSHLFCTFYPLQFGGFFFQRLSGPSKIELPIAYNFACYLSNTFHFRWVYWCNKCKRDVGRTQGKLVNHEPEDFGDHVLPCPKIYQVLWYLWAILSEWLTVRLYLLFVWFHQYLQSSKNKIFTNKVMQIR